ncbi:methionyl-tRNA formyltransferase [Streptomyces sulphureus]|uniref:methionyl-tRNA formyltransferase n=1 Tax=Streptomyces sulphureus TaxID=47758 RepID=UPI0003771D48|nr:formyltransferase family protein [Streptomyces sulphureus]
MRETGPRHADAAPAGQDAHAGAPLRIVLLSHSVESFARTHAVCTAAGHRPLAHVYARSLRPAAPVREGAPETAADLTAAIPRGVDLFLPGRAGNLAAPLAGYRPDLVVCNGFPWRLPPALLAVPTLGTLNIHTSLLPRYRGPIPVHWAIRNGDRETGVTVHWMDETFDTGPVLVQRGGVPLPDRFDPDGLLDELDALGAELLAEALPLAAAGAPGEPQRERDASYAGWMEDSFHHVDWSRPAHRVHHQVRTFRLGVPGARGPLAEVSGRRLRLLGTSLEPQRSDGRALRVECGDGPLWITEYEPVP